MIEFIALDASYSQERPLFEGLNLQLKDIPITTIVGKNGSGKSSIFKLLLKTLTPRSGSIMLDNEEVSKLSTNKLASLVSYVPQESTGLEGFSVKECIMMAHYIKRDEEISFEELLKLTRLEGYQQRPYSTLSGGEKQRVLLARALFANTKYLLIDEINNCLDLNGQEEVFKLIKTIATNYEKRVILILHDLSLAMALSDEVIILEKGKAVAQGSSEQVLSKENIMRYFNIEAFSYKSDKGKTINYPRWSF